MINTNKSPILGSNFPLEYISYRQHERVFYRFSGTKPLEVPYLYFDIGHSLYFCVACVIRHGAYHL